MKAFFKVMCVAGQNSHIYRISICVAQKFHHIASERNSRAASLFAGILPLPIRIGPLDALLKRFLRKMQRKQALRFCLNERVD
jgi:hypothetical protein